MTVFSYTSHYLLCYIKIVEILTVKKHRRVLKTKKGYKHPTVENQHGLISFFCYQPSTILKRNISSLRGNEFSVRQVCLRVLNSTFKQRREQYLLDQITLLKKTIGFVFLRLTVKRQFSEIKGVGWTFLVFIKMLRCYRRAQKVMPLFRFSFDASEPKLHEKGLHFNSSTRMALDCKSSYKAGVEFMVPPTGNPAITYK